MPTMTNTALLVQLKELIPQYVRGYVVANGSGHPIYEVRNINPQEFSDAAKSLICIYEYAADEFPQGDSLCEEMQVLSFRVAIRNMEKVGPQHDKQVSWTRSIFAGQGVHLNRFSGTYEGAPFVNQLLTDFGMFDFQTTPMQENYGKNDIWHTFGVRAKVSFQTQIIAA